MRKQLILLIGLSFLVIVIQAQRRPVDPTQQGLYKFADEYFRSDPFKGQFSDFLKHLINDPDITDKIIQKRTDTSFYTFFGSYKTYNPFFIKPKRIEILLQEMAIAYSDSAKAVDTIFQYQLLAYLDDNKKGREDLIKEFEKMHRQTQRKFFDTGYKEMNKGNEITGAFHNYFVPYYSLAPATILWMEVKDKQELMLSITLRFRAEQNETVLPMPFYRAK